MLCEQVQQGRALVKQVLLLVLLLDRAAPGCLLHPSAPLLFLKDASSKSSAQVVALPVCQRGAAGCAACYCLGACHHSTSASIAGTCCLLMHMQGKLQ